MTSSCSLGGGVIERFKLQFAAFEAEHAVLIGELENQVGSSNKTDPIGETYWDCVSDLKGQLGSDAANECSDDSDEQEEAISVCESWVADNEPSQVPLILWMKGVEEGREAILEAI